MSDEFLSPVPLAVGIDIGGTTVKAGLVAEDGRIAHRFSLPTPDYGDPRDLVDDLADQIRQRLGDHRLRGVGVGAPNGNVLRGTVEHPPNLPWPGVTPLADWLGKALDTRCVLTNDANAAALGEMIFGAARGMKHFLFVTLGTGVGSGIVVDGKLVVGFDGFAGELGHVIVRPGDRLCGCGRRGCLEQYASAPGFKRTYADLAGLDEPISSKLVMERAAEGDAHAQATIDQTAEILGLALANSVAYTQPEAIFLFGGLAEAGEPLLGPIRQQVEANLLPIYRGKVAVRPSGLPPGDAAILGAASLIWADG